MAGQPKLYCVNMEFTMYVMAKDKEDAMRTAEQHVWEEDTYGMASIASLATDNMSVDAEWSDSLPYGVEQDKTCKEIYKEEVAARIEVDPEFKERYERRIELYQRLERAR